MRIQINENSNLDETDIIINCKHRNTEIDKMIAMLHMMDLKLTGTKDNQTFILDASTVLYIDTVDKRTFLYTDTEVYETMLRLYELEEQLEVCDFFRAGKSCIINFHHIKALRSDIDGKILVTMSNQEKLKVSRQYTYILKNKLGVK